MAKRRRPFRRTALIVGLIFLFEAAHEAVGIIGSAYPQLGVGKAG